MPESSDPRNSVELVSELMYSQRQLRLRRPPKTIGMIRPNRTPIRAAMAPPPRPINTVNPSTWAAIVVALFIASIKATLVASFFMHLISEKKLIYSVLILTVVFFLVLLFVPLWTSVSDQVKS